MPAKVVDAHIHLWERESGERPWLGRNRSGLEQATAESAVEMMAAEQVDASVVVSPYGIYRFDASYALESARRFPSKFAVVAPVDPKRADLEEFVEHWADDPVTAGLRLVLVAQSDAAEMLDGAADRLLAVAARTGTPLCMGGRNLFDHYAYAARREPDLRVVIDHLGLYATSGGRGSADAEGPPNAVSAFDDLPRLLELAKYPNVFVKVTSVPMLSSDQYPFSDIWEPVTRVCEAFGTSRTMWGTDWTRALAHASYSEGVRAYRESPELHRALSSSETEQLMGGTAREVFAWAPGM